MVSFKKLFVAIVVLAQFSGFTPVHATMADPTPRTDKMPLVQLAILLDTSNSMDGLIEQAKSQLWKIANELAYAKRGGKTPMLQVALYEYGNNGLTAQGNWIRQVTPFTTNLDQVSQELFSLRTNGGEEYCGAVIRDAVHSLAWDSRSNVYKVIFIAGNEPFTQGPISYQESIAEAQAHDITVNTIFCGNYAEGVQTAWDAGARVGHGRYFNINQDQRIVAVPTPYDADIQKLGYSLNETYVPYGERGRQVMMETKAADRDALSAPAAAAPMERSVYKASAQYFSSREDVAGAVAGGTLRADQLKTESLPVALQNKSPEELEVYMKDQANHRAEIQKQIIALKEKRDSFMKDQKKAKNAPQTLDEAVQNAVREQGSAKGLKFK
jgi:hypothetical protein